MVKAYIIGNYFYLEFVESGNIISDLAKQVEIRLENITPATYNFFSDGLGEHSILLTDLQDRAGNSFTQTSWETFYTKNTGTPGTASQTPIYGPFGIMLTGEPRNRADVEFTFDKQPLIVDEVTAGSGVATHSADSRDVELAVGDAVNGSSCSLSTYPIPYTPGNGQIMEITGTLNGAGLANGEVFIVLRSRVTGELVDTEYPQDEWTENTLQDVDWSTSQIFTLDFQSLKVGTLRSGLNRSSVPVEGHRINNDNVRATGYWQQPTLPMFWRVYNDATYSYTEVGFGDANNGIFYRFRAPVSASHTARAICGTVKSEAGERLFDLPGFPSTAYNAAGTTLAVSTTLVPLVSIRAKSTFKGVPNLSLAIPQSFSVSTDQPIILVLVAGGTLTGSTWDDVDANNSQLEQNTTATAITGGMELGSFKVGAGRNSDISLSNIAQRAPIWDRQGSETGIYSICAIRDGAADAAASATVNQLEIR